MGNGPGTETLKPQHKGCLRQPDYSSNFVVLRRFQRSGNYQAIGDETAKTQPRHIHSIPNH